MGAALLLAAVFMAMTQLNLFPGGGTAINLSGTPLLIAIAASAVIGALLMLGIGSYGPSLVLFSLLGMNPRAAFPIMMGAGALVAMVGGIRFMRALRYDLRTALGLVTGGIPAVLIAAFIVRSLPLATLRWMVVIVVLYSAALMLRAAAESETTRSSGLERR
jgi:uncharacterized membrane protein YfcA